MVTLARLQRDTAQAHSGTEVDLRGQFGADLGSDDFLVIDVEVTLANGAQTELVVTALRRPQESRQQRRHLAEMARHHSGVEVSRRALPHRLPLEVRGVEVAKGEPVLASVRRGTDQSRVNGGRDLVIVHTSRE